MNAHCSSFCSYAHGSSPSSRAPRQPSGLKRQPFLLLAAMPLCSDSVIRFCRRGLRTYSSVIFPKLASFSSSSCALQKIDGGGEVESTVSSSYDDLQRGMRGHAASGDLRQALWTWNLMRNFPGKPTVNDFNALVHSYLKCGNRFSDVLLEVCLRMMESSEIAPNAITFNLIVNGLVAVGNFRAAFFVLGQMFTSGFLPSFTLLSRWLKKCIESNSLTDSLGVFDVMLMMDYVPTEPSVNMLICMLSKNGMIKAAYYVFSSLLAKGCFFGVYTLNPILWTLCKSGKTYTALQLFYLMKKTGLGLDVCSYTALVYGFCKEGLWEDAWWFVDEMQDSGLKPSLVTYTVLVKFLCVNGRVEEALRYPSLMETEGCSPDLLVYNIILQELSHLDRVFDITVLLDMIVSKGYSPDAYTVAVLGGGLLKAGRVGDCVGFLLDTISEGYPIDVAVYNIYLQCLCSQNRTAEALSLLERMTGAGFIPSNVSYNIILNGFCRENKFNKAVTLLSQFLPDVVSFNTILSWACRQRSSEIVEWILCRMQNEGITHDVFTSTCLIRYSCRVGKVSECLKLLDNMLLNGPKPTIVTFNVALHELCKSGSREIASRVFEKFSNSGFLPNAASYDIMSRAYARTHATFAPVSFVKGYG
ncbi:unnamed protein product [Linum tenue]|uniref:Pentatricopeptide repeat-containing protein n=1 Tax=Linum tenue TaxID=586396 RepID=A0AAV0JZB6_9ROSI|nr:unnamed protein product [Linum tenue]